MCSTTRHPPGEHGDSSVALRGFVFIVLVLGACSTDPATDAERQYQMAQRNGADQAELCRRARTVQEAYLQQGNEEKYRWWKLMADSACLNARLGG